MSVVRENLLRIKYNMNWIKEVEKIKLKRCKFVEEYYLFYMMKFVKKFSNKKLVAIYCQCTELTIKMGIKQLKYLKYITDDNIITKKGKKCFNIYFNIKN